MRRPARQGPQASAQGTPGGEGGAGRRAAAACLSGRSERVERAAQDSERQGDQAQGAEGRESRRPLQPFRPPGILLEAKRDLRERAWRGTKVKAARLAEKDRDVAEQERRGKEADADAARSGSRVTPDLEGGTPQANREGQSTSEKRVRGDPDGGGRARIKQCGVEERGEEGAMGARRPTSLSMKPTETHLGAESLLRRHFARNIARRGQGTVWGWSQRSSRSSSAT